MDVSLDPYFSFLLCVHKMKITLLKLSEDGNILPCLKKNKTIGKPLGEIRKPEKEASHFTEEVGRCEHDPSRPWDSPKRTKCLQSKTLWSQGCFESPDGRARDDTTMFKI